MNISDVEMAASLARQHSDNVAADIANAQSRGEHIRLTQLAFEAERLATELERITGK